MANIPFKSITFPGLPNKYTVPEISSDLMTAGKAADAKATGDALGALEDQFTEETDKLKADLDESFNKIFVDHSFSQGSLNTNNGSEITANNRCRTGYLSFDGVKMVVTPKTGYKVGCRTYRNNSVESLSFSTEPYSFSDATMLYRFIVSRTDDADVTPSDLPDDVLTITCYTNTDKSLTLSGKPADAGAVGDAMELSKNLFYITGGSITSNGVTFTENEDGTVTISGTATAGIRVYLMGATQISESNLESEKPYFISREKLRGTETNGVPYFSYRDSEHSSDVTVSNNTINVFSSNARIMLRLSKDYSIDATYKFSIVQSSEPVAFTPNGKFTAKDGTARYWIKKKKSYLAKNIYFTVPVQRPLPFDTASIPTDTEEVECVLRLPPNYTPNGEPTRLVLCCHGSGGYIDSENDYWWNNGRWDTFITNLKNAGYACFDANLYPTGSVESNLVGEHFGSPLYVQNCKKAYDYILENYNVYPEIFVHGCSMGGIGATAFTNIYPEIVIAESSFAGRDICLYLHRMLNTWTADQKLHFANAMGYASFAELESDKISHCIGYYPSLSLVSIDNGLLSAPDRASNFSEWCAFYAGLVSYSKNADVGKWVGFRKRPYKAWNSWDDDTGCTKLEELLKSAYNTISSCAYYNIAYDGYSHTEMCYGQSEDMFEQLMAYYAQFE